MSTEVQRYSFHMSTSQRTSGTATNSTFQLKQVISLLAKKGMFQVQVHGVSIPSSFYQLSTDISTVSVSATNGTTKTGTITLVQGNYNTITVIDQLNTQLTAFCNSSGPAGYTAFIPAFTSSYDTNTSLTTLSMTGVGTITINFGSNLSLGLFFGFQANTTFSSSSPQIATQVAVANPVSYLLLRSPTFKQYRNKEFLVQSDVYSDILYRIPIGTASGTYIQYNFDNEPVFIINNEITQFNIYLTSNLSYNSINLQGLDYGFSFSITEIVRPDYESIDTSMLVNMSSKNQLSNMLSDEERDNLMRQRDEELKRLELYKKKIAKNKDVLQNTNGEGSLSLQ